MGQAGYTDWIRVPFFRRCWVGPDKVEVTRPLIFGQGFLFDRLRRVVTIRRYLFGVTLSEEEIEFSDLTVRLRTVTKTDQGYIPGGGMIATLSLSYVIDMHDRDGKRFHIRFNGNSEGRAGRVLDVIRTLVEGTRKL